MIPAIIIDRVNLRNPTRTPRIIHDGIEGSQKAIRVSPGQAVANVRLARHIVDHLRSLKDDLVVEVNGEVMGRKPPVVINGMVGIGDCLHQRAALREMMKTHEVWLKSCHYLMYHDLIEQGLHMVAQPTSLRAQARTMQRERHLFGPTTIPPGAQSKKLGYGKPEIDLHGSILATVMARFGVKTDRPDFSLPLRPEWVVAARALVAGWDLGGRRLMVHRPIVLRKEWSGATRNPDPAAYDAIYRTVRDQYFVVSVADLVPGLEWTVGPEADVDVKLHKGELDFPTMAALWAEADLVFCNAGFAPVLAQAVGTPSIVVYGGRESFRTTQAAGAHLAPTLGIDPDRPCDCHSHSHNCDKRITLPPAIERVRAFVAEHGQRHRTLIVGTCYVDSPHRLRLLRHWIAWHQKVNPQCDFLLVDSASPKWIDLLETDLAGWAKHEPGTRQRRAWHSFSDNVGHLSRGGRDGWGRALCFGLDAAVAGGYSHAVHIEGDSLFRLPVAPIVSEMARDGTKVASTPVARMGLNISEFETGWVETGLMFFSTKYLAESKLTERYAWERRKVTPTPEKVVRGLLGNDLKMMPWKSWRGNKKPITPDNVGELDWVTHCWDRDEVYDRFVGGGASVAPKVVKLGYGPDDFDVDASKPLPFFDVSVDFLVCEHRAQKMGQYEAIAMLKECRRVLKLGGVLRIAVPSLEQIAGCTDPEYVANAAKNGGPVRSILYAWGSRSPWTWSLLEALLFYAGFDKVDRCEPHKSRHQALVGVETHHRVIGDKFFLIETLIAEASCAS